MNLKKNEIKIAMLTYIKEHAEFTTDFYSIAFFTKEKGLYSGVTKVDRKVYGFVIDFSKRKFFIEGITGKHLVESAHNLSVIFPVRKLKEAKNSKTLQKLYTIGLMLGDQGDYMESENIGRGILRAITKYPVAEKLSVLPFMVDNRQGYTMRIIKFFQKRYNEVGDKSLTKLSGLSKRHFLSFSESYNDELAYDLLNAGEDLLATYDQIQDITRQVDKERGYHDATVWLDLVRKTYRYWHGAASFLANVRKDSAYQRVTVSFIDLVRYLYFSCYHQQALNPQEACETLSDYWKLISGAKGVTKYPRYLKTAHDVASRNFSFVKDYKKSMGVYENYVGHKQLEGMNSSIAFIVAETPQEISDEANQQSNCVAGYIDSVARGETTIMFMRYPSNITNSVVTFEIKDGALVQAYARFDQKLNAEESGYLLGYCKAMGLKLNKRLALDYSAKSKIIRNLIPVSDFHDKVEVDKMLDENSKKLEMAAGSVQENRAMQKSA